jgi:hypothetical protein
MEFVATVVGLALAWVIGTLITEQTKVSTPIVASWIARRAARRLPQDLRVELEEEWLAVLENTPGPLLKLKTAVGFYCAIGRLLADQLRDQPRENPPQRTSSFVCRVPDFAGGESYDEFPQTRDGETEFQKLRNLVAHTSYAIPERTIVELFRLIEKQHKSFNDKDPDAN